VFVLGLYAVPTGLLAASYQLWPPGLRWLPYLAVTLSVIPAVVVGLRRAPRTESRLSWWMLLAAMTLYGGGNVVSTWQSGADGRLPGQGGAADLSMAVGGVLLLASGLLTVAKLGRRDVGGIIDAVITAVALSGLLWDAVLLPVMTARGVPGAHQLIVFLNTFLMAGVLGAMVRVSSVSDRRLAPIHLFTAGIAFALLANVIGAFVDAASGERAALTNQVYLIANLALGCASLHPRAGEVAILAERPVDRLSSGRLAFLGLMLALAPLVGGGRVLLGLPTDGLVIALSAAGLIPLAMVRIAGLSRARREAERALRRLASTDPLTGLPNRAAGVDRIDAELRTGSEGLVVLFGDLDGFKPVNDRLGHAAGDELLIAVADHLRAGGMVSRFGGDEFVIICRGPDQVEEMSERLRALAGRELTAAGETVRIGVSVGVAHARPGDTTDDLLTRADLAMYEAKRSAAVARA
jgi:diguanylate cyclase (GGDEF)-like protein